MNNIKLFNGDCLEIMKDLSDSSIDIIISDLPYGRFKHLEWDKKIDFEKMWRELWRISKPTTPIFLFGDFKFAVEIYNSQPKYFKYEIVWNKKTTTTPLMSRKRFGKCTEYILIFYKKQPVYNYAKYHKIINKKNKPVVENNIIKKEENDKKTNYENKTSDGVIDYKRDWRGGARYKPTLPINIIEKEENDDIKNEVVYSSLIIGKNKKMYHAKSGKYEPRLPVNIIEKEEKISDDWNGGKYKSYKNKYKPSLPINFIEKRESVVKRNGKIIKKLTEKPQFILKHLLKYFSNEGDVCLDFCMGSGSLGLACIDLNRKFIGIEKNKEFFDITEKRLTETINNK